MAYTDLTPAELYQYRANVEEPADFLKFWDETLAEARRKTQPTRIKKVTTPFPQIDFYDLTFSGYNGDEIKAWLSGPKNFMQAKNLPVIIEYIGYGSGRGKAGHQIKWPAAGYVHFHMDTRGQGGDYGVGGDTSDPHPTTPGALGFLTNGIENPHNLYYRRLITDAVRAIDETLQLPCINPEKIVLTGISQGGGLALIAGALHPQVKAIMPDVAWLCDYHRGAILVDVPPYRELKRYLKSYPERYETALGNLAYVDGVNFARHAHAPALFSVALMDDCVPPSTTFGAYNEYQGEAEMVLYPFNGHEGGTYHHFLKQIEWLRKILN